MIYSYDYNTIDANEFVAMSAVSDSYELTRVYSCELIGASVRAPYCSKSSFFSSLGSQYDAARSALERRQQISIVSRYAPVLMLIDPPCRLPTGQTDRRTDILPLHRRSLLGAGSVTAHCKSHDSCELLRVSALEQTRYAAEIIISCCCCCNMPFCCELYERIFLLSAAYIEAECHFCASICIKMLPEHLLCVL